jgi:pyroglutamyl-peptidase
MANIFDPRSKVLLTGFGPFPGVPENASGKLVKDLAREARCAMPEYHFVPTILPTEWIRAPQILADLYERYKPVLALHFGVASEALGFRIETSAGNSCRASPDETNQLPSATVLLDEGADAFPVTVDASSIAARLKATGYPASLSRDAGGYLCNAVLYHSLVQAERRGNDCRVGFVHIPADLTKPRLTLPAAVAGALEIVKFALEDISAAAALTSV